MKRRFQGLHQADPSEASDIPDGMYLVRVQRAQYRWHPQKPFYLVRFRVLEPQPFAHKEFTGRLYCTAKALWKLTWFLRDFGYDADLLDRDEVEDQHLVGLRGVVKLSHTVLHGTTVLNLDGFASASQWEELAATSSFSAKRSEVA